MVFIWIWKKVWHFHSLYFLYESHLDYNNPNSLIIQYIAIIIHKCIVVALYAHMFWKILLFIFCLLLFFSLFTTFFYIFLFICFIPFTFIKLFTFKVDLMLFLYKYFNIVTFMHYANIKMKRRRKKNVYVRCFNSIKQVSLIEEDYSNWI